MHDDWGFLIFNELQVQGSKDSLAYDEGSGKWWQLVTPCVMQLMIASFVIDSHQVETAVYMLCCVTLGLTWSDSTW